MRCLVVHMILWEKAKHKGIIKDIAKNTVLEFYFESLLKGTYSRKQVLNCLTICVVLSLNYPSQLIALLDRTNKKALVRFFTWTIPAPCIEQLSSCMLRSGLASCRLSRLCSYNLHSCFCLEILKSFKVTALYEKHHASINRMEPQASESRCSGWYRLVPDRGRHSEEPLLYRLYIRELNNTSYVNFLEYSY